MASCNLKMTDDCYGCIYYGSGDYDGCKLTIEFHKTHTNHTDKEYERYMINKGRKKI